MEKWLNEMGRNDTFRLFDRRTALKVGTGAALATVFPNWLLAATTNPTVLLWGNLVHLSYNMWGEHYKPDLRFDDHLWDELLPAMVGAGMNLLVIDLGDGVQYKSHPEIAVKNAWTLKRLEAELARLRKMGLEPIPKLNFSTAHNFWLGRYRRMAYTDKYYAVCRELIAEVCALFGKPRFFHLGMDEEDIAGQRQQDLWWHNFLLMVAEVEKNGVRPWIWSDYFWDHREEFLKQMPKTVVQGNWYYGSDFKDKKRVPPFRLLAEGGYDQIPTGSNWETAGSFLRLVEYCTKVIPPARLLGFCRPPGSRPLPPIGLPTWPPLRN